MIYVTRPPLPDRERLSKYIDRIYSTHQLTNNGPLVQELTERLKDHLGVDNLLLVANGTIALQIALKLLDVQGEVVTTPFTFPATSSSVVWHGAKPVYADIDPDTLNIDLDQAVAKINGETGAALVTHVYGNPCDVEKMDSMMATQEISVIYDAAQSFGVKSEKSVFSYGEISTISFHATKIFHTVEGGALVFRNPELLEEAARMINFGFDSNGYIFSLGINGKMNEFEAAMGLAILDETDEINAALRTLFRTYEAELTAELQRPVWNKDFSRNYSYYPVLFESEKQLLRVENRLNGQGINPRRYFKPSLDTVPVYGGRSDCPVSQHAVRRVMCLPIYSTLPLEEVSRICSLVNSAL